MAQQSSAPIAFGIFDWLDESGRDASETYEDRLKMAELADKTGYYCYHLAEHHGSALSSTPSPNVFLSAVAQRTQRLHVGALTYLLPLYNPLRLLEELCMLDQLSRGRLEIGVSRGPSPIESAQYHVSPEDARPMFREVMDLLIMGFNTGELNYAGKYYQYDHVKTRLRPYQKPYPPFWYPTSNVESIEYMGAQGMNAIFSLRMMRSMDRVIEMVGAYQQQLAVHQNDSGRANGHIARPFSGLNFHIHVADTEEAARRQAEAAYKVFHANFIQRFIEHGASHSYGEAADFDKAVAEGHMLVGTPQTVADKLSGYLEMTQANYILGAFAWGSFTRDQLLRSIDLFAREVMPRVSVAATQPA
ncbi:MAG TPA: LLM class flavin-dependent oxidoreductase [Dehalococcoidia bacterium]|nr:LLM class flavin-dependent oxidoreductase [Dehalococcoidia bacterium]